MNWIEALRRAIGLGRSSPSLSEARSKMRINASIPLTLALPQGAQVEGRSTNLNSRGLTVEIPTPLRRGQKVDVVFRATAARPARQDLRVTAQVIWSRRKADNMQVDAGLAFVSFGTHRADDILAFLRQELAVPILDDKQKRKFRRVNADWTVSFSTPGNEPLEGRLRDVSPCGLLFTSPSALLLWSELSIVLKPLADGPSLRAQGFVRRCSRLEGEDGWEIACPLLEMTEPDRQSLIGHIERHLRSHR